MTIEQLMAGVREDGMAAKKKGVPRVSSVLAPMKPKFTKQQQENGKIAMERGTRAHKAIEYMVNLEGLQSGILPEVEPDIMGYCASFRDWWRHFREVYHDYKFAAEIPLGMSDDSMRGTADLIGIREYSLFRQSAKRYDVLIADWKTGRGLYESYAPQLAAYRQMVIGSLMSRGVENLAVQTLIVLLDANGNRPRTSACHQMDAAELKRLLPMWHERYRTDEQFREKADYAFKMESSGQ